LVAGTARSSPAQVISAMSTLAASGEPAALMMATVAARHVRAQSIVWVISAVRPD